MGLISGQTPRAAMRRWGLGTIALAALSLPACTTIVIKGEDQHDIVSIGVTRLVVPERKGDLIAFKRTGVGLGYGSAVGDAAWLGFDTGEWVLADPKDCQMLVIIRSDAEAASAKDILEKLEGDDVCYVNDTQP